MNTNTHLTHSIYWPNKPVRSPTTLTPTTQLSVNLGIAVSLYAGTVITGFCRKTEASLAHFLPQGMRILLIPMLGIIKTVSLFIQPVALAV